MKVLIGSAGGYTGQYLVDYYTDELGCEVHAFDVNGLSYSHYKCGERFYIASPINDEESFLSWFVETIKMLDIKLYLPTLSKEFELVARNADWLGRQTDCYFIVSPEKAIRLFKDKSVYYPILRSAGIDVPRIVTSPDDAVFPLFYKETSSSGSHNAHVKRTTAELQSALVEQAGMCIEYIEGREVTVDCFVSPEGQLLSFNIRIREKTLGGMVVICRNYIEPRIEPIVRQITTRYRFAGCINMQFMLTDERVVLIDMNTRYPSWGLPLTVESGIKVPELMLCYAEGRTQDKSMYENDGKDRVVYRHFRQYYEILS